MAERCTVEGAVQSLIFQNEDNGYTVLSLLTEDGELVTVVGCIPCAAPGEGMTVTGVWTNHPSYGPQFAAESVERRMPRTEEEIVSYLSSRHSQGHRPRHGPAAGRPLRGRHSGRYRGGAGAASDRQGHHRQAGHGAVCRLPGADGAQAGHGVPGPV